MRGGGGIWSHSSACGGRLVPYDDVVGTKRGDNCRSDGRFCCNVLPAPVVGPGEHSFKGARNNNSCKMNVHGRGEVIDVDDLVGI